MTRPFTRPQEDSELLIEDKIQFPRKFRVLLHNDDYTTMDFVVAVLMYVFRKSEDEATAIMLAIHEEVSVNAAFTPMK